MRYSKDATEIGNKLGPRLVELISQTVASTKHKLLYTDTQARIISSQTIIDRAGHEIADLYRPVMEEMIKDRDLPPYLREYLTKVLSGTHQWHAIGGLLFQASGAPSALSVMLSNFLAPGVRFAVAKDPQLLPSNETLAQLTARGIRGISDVYDFSAGQGYSSDLVDNLVEASKAYPDVSTLLELLRRGHISDTDARLALTRNGVPDNWHAALLGLENSLISPADLADMVVRGIMPQQDAANVAIQFGYSPSDFDLIVQDTGEPLALMQLLEAYRRGFIDESTLEHGIKQSRTRDEWIPVAKQLRFSPMSVADAVNAVVQNHMTQADAETIAEQNGLEPGALDTLVQTAGEPLSRTECEELYNRGLMTEAEVIQALRESRLKDKYLDFAFELHTKVPPIYTIQHAVRYGGVTIEYAIQSAMAQGYSQTDAELIVNSSQGEKLQTAKDKTISAIESMIENNLIPESDAQTLITSMGYSDTEAGFILQTADFRRQAKAVTAVVNAVKSKYLSHHIDRNGASGLLDAAGIPAAQRDYNLALWDIELQANVRQLTPAQVVKAFKLNLIDQQSATDRLVFLGYSPDDADLLLQGA